MPPPRVSLFLSQVRLSGRENALEMTRQITSFTAIVAPLLPLAFLLCPRSRSGTPPTRRVLSMSLPRTRPPSSSPAPALASSFVFHERRYNETGLLVTLRAVLSASRVSFLLLPLSLLACPEALRVPCSSLVSFNHPPPVSLRFLGG